DPMNADETLLRSRVRHRALPLLREILGEHLDENLARTADLVGPDADHLDAEATALLDSLRRDGGELREERDLLLLDVHALAAAPAPLRTRVLRDASRSADRAMARHGGAGSTKSLLRRQVLAIDALVVSWHGQSAVTVPGRIEGARRDERDLLLLDVHALAAAPAPLRTRVLRDASRSADRAMARHGGAGSTKSLLRRQVLAIDALVVSWHGQSAVTVPGRIEVARRDGLLVWRRIDP